MRKHSSIIPAVGVFLIAFLAVAQAQNISTLAGGGPNNLPAKSASIGVPWAVVQHGTTTYISDNLSNRVFKVDGNGNLTVFAGNIVNIYNQNNHGDGHAANTASLNAPQGIALDAAGNLYIADTANNAIRVVNVQTGVIQTVAGDGNGTAGYTGDGSAATSATLNGPSGVWLDSDGNIYIADSLNSAIRVVNMQTGAIHFPGSRNAASVDPGNIATIAGTGLPGFGDGSATTAQFNIPGGLFVTGSANSGSVLIYVADTINNRIRVVNTRTTSATVAGVSILAGNVATVAGNSTACADPTGTCNDGPTATIANLNNPVGVSADGPGNIYIADTNDNKIRKVTSLGAISTIAGTGTRCTFGSVPCGEDGPATSALLWLPTGVVLDNSGHVMIADQNDDAIRTIDSGNNLETTVGQVFNTAYSGDKSQTVAGIATNAEMREPRGVTSDANGNVFIADTLNNTIRKVRNGVITSAVGNGFACFTQLCGDGGQAVFAQLSFPFDVKFDATGNMWIADSGDQIIRVVNNQSTAIHVNGATIQPGTILSVVGNGNTCASSTDPCGDGGAATAAQLNLPNGIAMDAHGNVYIADTNDNRIRVVNNQASQIIVAGVHIPAGQIATIAGDGNACADPTTACGDGAAATSANLNLPGGIAVDSTGAIYIADTGDNRVRVVDTDGTIHPFAGTGTACTTDCKNGGLAIDALLDAPQSVFVDLAGNVFIADAFDFEVREVTQADGLMIHGVAGNETRGFSGDGGSATSAQLFLPYGVSGDPFGNLLIADRMEWRVRKVTSLVVTEPRADLSTSQLAFSNQPIHTTSAGRSITVSNDSFGMSLTFSGNPTLSGTNASEFAIASNTCTGSLPAGSACTITIKFSPSAKGARVATLTITDNAGGVPGSQQTVALSGTGLAAAGLGEQVDYFGEGKADFTVWRPSNGTFYSVDPSGKGLTKQWGASTDIPVVGDYDGDGRTDFAVWRPSNGTWYVVLSSNNRGLTKQLGQKGDVLVPGDYDGDGKTDMAVWRPSTGTWFILQSSNGQMTQRTWGASTDLPIPGDYDGDGKTDIAVWRPSNGTWYIIQSSNGKGLTRQWGAATDKPEPADYDGDGKTDIAVWRPSTGVWYIIQSSNGASIKKTLGATGDVPVARDYDGDGKADVAVWHPPTGTWSVIQSTTGKTITKVWGASTDLPMNKPAGQ